MYDELAQIRETSMAMDREENELGVSCIAVPVFDIHHRVPYAISISLSTSRLKTDRREKICSNRCVKPHRLSLMSWDLPFANKTARQVLSGI